MAADMPPEMPHWWDAFVSNGELVLGSIAAGVVSLVGWVARIEARLQAMRGLPKRVETLEAADDAKTVSLARIDDRLAAVQAGITRIENIMLGRSQ